ncbi:MAG: hypothetical protein MJ068_03520 [Clostridia bacterium]|nr:hypothetical protein [Clostridia bacterium]
MDVRFLTPGEIWGTFSPSAENLEKSLISQETTDNITCSKQFFTSEKVSDGSVRVYSETYYDTRWIDKRPAIVIVPPVSKYDFRDVAMELVKDGYIVEIIDYCGSFTNGEKTSYPKSLSYASWPDCKEELTNYSRVTSESVYFIWSKIVRKAITLLCQLSITDNNKISVFGSATGAEISWITAGIDKRVQALIAINGGGYLWAERTKSPVPQTDEDTAFSSAIGAETYARMTTCPILFIASANSTYYDLDRSKDIINNAKSTNKTFVVSQSSSVQFTREAFNSMREWLRRNLSAEPKPSYNPLLVFENIDGKLYARIKTIHKAKNKTIYINYGEPYSYARTWKSFSSLQKVGTHEYTCIIPVENINDGIVGYATMEYENGYMESTQIAETSPAKLSIIPDVTFENQVNRVFYDGSMNLGPFTAVTNSTILENNTLIVKEGPAGIKGISAIDGSIYMRHNANNMISVTRTAILHFDVYSPENKKLKLIMYSYPERKPYFAYVQLKGGNFWQNVLLDADAFKNEEGRPLQDFNTSKLFRISGVENLIFNNFLWI